MKTVVCPACGNEVVVADATKRLVLHSIRNESKAYYCGASFAPLERVVEGYEWRLAAARNALAG